MKRQLYGEVAAKETLAVAVRSTDTTVNGTSADLWDSGKKFRSALLVVHTGTMTDGTHTVELQESDDDSTFTAVADADLMGTEPAISSTDDNTIFEVGYRGTKRYVRASVTVAGTTSGGTYGAVILLGYPALTHHR